jgi:hypothetical protein
LEGGEARTKLELHSRVSILKSNRCRWFRAPCAELCPPHQATQDWVPNKANVSVNEKAAVGK